MAAGVIAAPGMIVAEPRLKETSESRVRMNVRGNKTGRTGSGAFARRCVVNKVVSCLTLQGRQNSRLGLAVVNRVLTSHPYIGAIFMPGFLPAQATFHEDEPAEA